MLKPFSLVFFIAVMVWIGAILISSDPQTRMDRFCIPVEYSDRASTSGMQLVDAGWGESTHKFFQNMHYGCRFVVWRMFYEEEWERAKGAKPAARIESAPAKNEEKPGAGKLSKEPQSK